MFYNTKDYLKNVNKSKLVEDCPISNRITQLLGLQFSRWRDGWYKKIETPPLGHLKDYVLKEEEYVLDGSAALRKGKAIEISLSRVLISKEYSKRANLYKIHPAEIIVGNMPQLSLGTGSQVMEYLRDDEKISFFFKNLNEYSASGHNVPDYSLLVKLGAGELKSRFEEKLKTATGEKKDYYQSVVWSLNGFSNFVSSYGDLAMEMAKSLPETEKMEIQNLEEISRRMKKIATKKPEGFLESLQLIFIMNCALHQIGESMSIGRLDQWLIDSYNEDISNGLLNKENAQEILDAFWLKMDETVLYNSTHMNDYLNYGSGAVFYSAGNFPQGAAMNQWVQQVTVGGYKANNSATPEAASNDLTVMCLRSARRLPMNAPCLSLRVHKDMDPTLVEEAAKAVLSGGAHPVLLHDDKLIPALKASGPMDLEDARDYTSDGCYEPIIQGKTEWAFSYVPVLPIVGMAMNQGATIMGAGPTHLNGLKEGWNSPVAQDIKNFDEFMDIFFTQWRWAMNKFYNSLMNGYGDLWNVCPSPLFSSMVHDTLETGKDMTNGGARYHIIAPMMCGMANTIDSLHSINKMVFDKDSCITTLPELLQTLRCNWGQNMIEPWNSSIAGDMRAEDKSLRYKSLRDFSLSLNKFGQGNDPEIVALAERVVQGCVDIIHDSLDNAIPPIKDAYEKIKEKYKLPNRDFAFTVTPGVGTFEDNVGLGEGMGASADGRTMGTPIAEDFAPAPSPQDLPIDNKPRNIFKALKDWNIEAINLGISNAAPVDVNIHEEFPLEDLSKVITQFANSEIGSNMMTITCGDTSTFEKAAQFPERYDLVRVRMGGWSEFFVAMFSNHQQHIMRRPFFVHQDCPHKHQ
ncbi:MAG: pyruvate-formate lyase [Halioglobus sp.]|jgi:pyruvate-formate lyase